MFLQKMKIELADFKMDIVGERNPTPPRYFTSVDMTLHIAGKNIDPKKMDRAVSLSHLPSGRPLFTLGLKKLKICRHRGLGN